VLFVGLLSWYQTILDGGDFGVAKQAVVVGVWGQAALLAVLYVRFLSAPLALAPSPRSPSPRVARAAPGTALPASGSAASGSAASGSAASGSVASTPAGPSS